MIQSAVEQLFAERWSDVCQLVEAFSEFEDKALAAFENDAVPAVRAWLSERGFETDFNAQYAEVHAFKAAWRNSDGEPMAKFCVGGMFPKGLAKVDAKAPYLWTYLKLEKPRRSEVADRLRSGAQPMWLDPETNDRGPLGRYLAMPDAERFKVATDPKQLAAFVMGELPQLLQLETLVDSALRS
jgi:hypothetical protein